MKTPDILLPALRQYQHNNCSGMIAGFDYETTLELFQIIDKTIKAQSQLIVSYKNGERPPDWISVEERLPEKEGKYLACWFTEENELIFEVSEFYKNTKNGDVWFSNYSNTVKVTHWLPLPVAPELFLTIDSI